MLISSPTCVAPTLHSLHSTCECTATNSTLPLHYIYLSFTRTLIFWTYSEEDETNHLYSHLLESQALQLVQRELDGDAKKGYAEIESQTLLYKNVILAFFPLHEYKVLKELSKGY